MDMIEKVIQQDELCPTISLSSIITTSIKSNAFTNQPVCPSITISYFSLRSQRHQLILQILFPNPQNSPSRHAMPGLNRLSDKTAIVTGASAGFGRGIATKLATEGCSLVLVDIDGDNLTRTTESLPNGPHSCVTGDVTQEKTWHSALETCLSKFGKLDILVNCAGVVHLAGPSHEVDEEEFDRVMRINVKPLFLSTKVVVGGYWKKEGKKGSVVNISSISEPRYGP